MPNWVGVAESSLSSGVYFRTGNPCYPRVTFLRGNNSRMREATTVNTARNTGPGPMVHTFLHKTVKKGTPVFTTFLNDRMRERETLLCADVPNHG